MPINTHHPEYDTYATYVTRTDACYNGDVRTTDFIAKLSGQSDVEYKTYIERGNFVNTVRRTAHSIVGAMTRKPFETSADISSVRVDGAGSIEQLVQSSILDILVRHRFGILVDYDIGTSEPYLVRYTCDQIINWCDDFVVLEEHYYEPDPNDHYTQIVKERYRELYLDETGLYAVRIWEKASANDRYSVVDTYEPTMRGIRLNYIPFIQSTKFDRPILFNLSEINISHFRTSTEIEHSAFMTSIPQPWSAGELMDDNSTQLRLGSLDLWKFEDGASVQYLEFTGAGIQSLMSILEMKERQMASVGSQLLQSRKGVESVDALRIRTASEQATLIDLATCVEDVITIALNIHAEWSGQPTNIVFEMNKDFSASILDATQINTLLSLYNEGAISYDTFLNRLYEGEIVDDVDQEKKKNAPPA